MRAWRGGRWALAAAAAGLAAPAHAWYLPEHAEFTRLAAQDHLPAAVTVALEAAVAEAAVGGLPLCTGGTPPLHLVPSDWRPTRWHPQASRVARCIPWTALPALAGDHANDAAELALLLTERPPQGFGAPGPTVAGKILGAAAAEWDTFLSRARPAVREVWTRSLRDRSGLLPDGAPDVAAGGGRDHVRSLDAMLQMVDHGYATRAGGSKAHFQDATASLQEVLRRLGQQGDADNALAQAVLHHIASLQQAVLARGGPMDERAGRLRKALLEHAFAVHFVQDAFAAGHVATEPDVTPSFARTRRHDHFNRVGLAMTRALAEVHCRRDVEAPVVGGPSACWLAHGDGQARWSDRVQVAEATARVQLQLALALNPDLGRHLRETSPDGERQHAASLLDPEPPWTRAGSHRAVAPGSAIDRARIHALIAGAEAALEALAHTPEVPSASAGEAGRRLCDALPPALNAAAVDAASPAPRGAIGSPAASLFRPLLAAWPTAQADVTTLQGSDAFGTGPAWQVLVGTSGTWAPAAEALALPAVGVGAGVAWRADSIFPHRNSRAVLELNAALGQSAVLPQGRFLTFVVAEGRLPALTLLAFAHGVWTGNSGSFDLIGERWGLGLYGARAYWLLEDSGVRPTGWDVEVAYFVVNRPAYGRPSSLGDLMDTELRLRVGATRVRRLGIEGPERPAVTVALELAGGYSTFIE